MTVSTKKATTIAASPPWRSARRRSRCDQPAERAHASSSQCCARGRKSPSDRSVGIGERQRRVGRQRDPPARARDARRSRREDRAAASLSRPVIGSSSSQAAPALATSRARARRRRWPGREQPARRSAAKAARRNCASAVRPAAAAAAHARPRTHSVSADGQDRLQRVGMADEVEPRAMRRRIRRRIGMPSQAITPLRARRQPGHQAQQARFAAAVGPGEHQRAARGQGEIEALENAAARRARQASFRPAKPARGAADGDSRGSGMAGGGIVPLPPTQRKHGSKRLLPKRKRPRSGEPRPRSVRSGGMTTTEREKSQLPSHPRAIKHPECDSVTRIVAET